VRDERIANIGTSTGFVIDDDLLPPNLGELFSDDPRIDVRWPAGRKRHNHVNCSIGPSIYASRANQVRHKYRRGA
jgi:hypothetical protein